MSQPTSSSAAPIAARATHEARATRVTSPLQLLSRRLLAAVLGAFALLGAGADALALDKISFGTNWRAQGGHGGFYQALADGTYEKYGLQVEIVQGGPQVNNRPLLSAGKLDLLMAGNLLLSFDNVKNGIPTVVVASFFQRDPQVLMAHEGAYKDFADLKNAKTVLIGKDAQFSFWQWLKSEHGFRDEQLRPYTFNIAPFLQDKKMVQQGYASSEPFTAATQGAKPAVYLLADHGWNTYSTTLEARSEFVRAKPQLVQRFIDASIIGWYNFLYGDRKPAIELIKKVNPEMSDALINAEAKTFIDLKIIDSDAALTKGIGAIEIANVKTFYDKMVKAGLYKAGDVDPAKVATEQFVNKGVGLDLKKKLLK